MSNKDNFKGQTNDLGQPHGRGVMFYSNARYQGEFKDGELHGQGKMIFPDGGRTEGEWKNGILSSGTIHHAKGNLYWLERYEGQLSMGTGLRHGRGTNYYTEDMPNGLLSEEMTFENDKPINCQGKQIWRNGVTFIGEYRIQDWAPDKGPAPDGWGTKTYSDGYQEKGRWRCNPVTLELEKISGPDGKPLGIGNDQISLKKTLDNPYEMFECPYCPKVFAAPRDVKQHVKDKHKKKITDKTTKKITDITTKNITDKTTPVGGPCSVEGCKRPKMHKSKVCYVHKSYNKSSNSKSNLRGVDGCWRCESGDKSPCYLHINKTSSYEKSSGSILGLIILPFKILFSILEFLGGIADAVGPPPSNAGQIQNSNYYSGTTYKCINGHQISSVTIPHKCPFCGAGMF